MSCMTKRAARLLFLNPSSFSSSSSSSSCCAPRCAVEPESLSPLCRGASLPFKSEHFHVNCGLSPVPTGLRTRSRDLLSDSARLSLSEDEDEVSFTVFKDSPHKLNEF